MYDPNDVAWDVYNEEGYIPLNIIFDRDFIIRYKAVGYNAAAVKTRIESLL